MQFKFACPNCGRRLEADSSYSGTMAECPDCEAAVHVPDARISPGTTIGGHRLEALIGRGGMGEVYRATQLAMDRQVAVKVLAAALTENQMFVDRFLFEVKTAAKLEHPNIVTAFDAGEDDGVYYLTMGFVDGETLQDRLERDGTFPEEDVLHIAERLAAALKYAWETFGILHRDIKPANIMLDRAGNVKLMDLGVAKIVGEETGMTLTGMALGTPNYMSPEQVRGLSDIDCRADIYSVGCTMFHLLTGRQPYVGKNPLEVMNQHVNSPLPSVRGSRPSVSPECERLVHKLMAKDRRKRPQDWQGVIDEITRLSAENATARRMPGSARRLRRWTPWAAGVFLVLSLALLLVSAVKQRRNAQPAAAGTEEALSGVPKTESSAKTAAGRDLRAPELETVANHLVNRRLDDAVTSWQRLRGQLEDRYPLERLREIDSALEIVADVPGHVMASFERDVGRSVMVGLREEGKVLLTIERLEGRNVHTTRRRSQGDAAERVITFADLDQQEQLRRVAIENDRVAGIVKGLLFLRMNRPVVAVMTLKRSRNPLADAIVAVVEERPKWKDQTRPKWRRPAARD